MKPRYFYKHLRNTDVIMYVKDIRYSTRGVYKVRCEWYNIVNPKNVFLLSAEIDRFELKPDQLKEWKLYEPIFKEKNN